MDLNRLAVFQRVAQASSFSIAARTLGIDRTRVSRVIGALEAELGVQLFVRTTRTTRLTPEGEALSRQIAGPLASLESTIAAVPAHRVIPSGELTLTATVDVGRTLVAPLLPRFRARYPAVRVKMMLSDEILGLARGVDLALRLGRTGGQSAVARKLRRIEAAFYAAPAYLERRGVPLVLSDLADHEGLWPMVRGQRSFATSRPAPPPAIACGDFGTLAELACAGGGIALLPTFVAARHLSRGDLLRVLPEITLGSTPLYLISAPPAQLPARVIALRSFFLEELSAK